MSDRKTINKYYPPDFDPSKLTRRKKVTKSASAALQTVRLMSPFSMRCTSCGEFIYRGKKFNARKDPTNQEYLGIKIYRFHIRCPRCAGEIIFRTEPKISDYVTESGAVRNHEPWRAPEEEEEDLEQRLDRLEREEKEEQEKEQAKLYGKPVSSKNGDPISELEEKVQEAKREMDIQDELDDLRTRNARIDQASVGLIEVAQKIAEPSRDELDDEEAAKKAFKRTSDGDIIRQATTDSPVDGKVNTTKQTVNLFKPMKRAKRANALGIKKKSLV